MAEDQQIKLIQGGLNNFIFILFLALKIKGQREKGFYLTFLTL
jgi:hypothetical protein